MAHLQQASAIAAELGDPDDLCRAYHNLGCTYLDNGRYQDAVDTEMECLDLARRFGSVGGYGAAAMPTAAEALLWLGRFQEAERLLGEAFDLDLAPKYMVFLLGPRGLHRLWRGDVEGARKDLTWIVERSKVSLEPQDSAPAYARLAAVATWDGRPEDARAAVAGGLASLDEADDPYLVAELCQAGLAAEAAIAGQAAARRDEKAQEQASRIAPGLLERARAAAGADGVAVTRAVQASSSRTSSESRDSDSVVNPTRSANRTDTSRRSAAGAGWATGS